VAYSIAPEDYNKDLPLFVAIKENRLLNEFFLYVLEDLHTTQGLSALKFTSDDPEFVKETVEHVYTAISATPTAPPMPATRALSRQLVAYLAAFLPTSPYYKYSATLAMLEETSDETFKAYMTRKTQGWFRRWGCNAAAASPGPGAAAPPSGGGAGAATPGRLPAPDASDDEAGSALITPGGPVGGGGSHVSSPLLDMAAGGTPADSVRSRAHAIQDFQTSAAKHRPSSPMLEGILTLKSFMIPHPKLCDLPADIAGGWVMISWALSWPLSCLIS
jgi:hypothetical protein